MSAITELIDVVEHLVNTHTNWNQDLSQVVAKAKIDAARAQEIAKEVAPIADDVDGVVHDVAGDGGTNA